MSTDYECANRCTQQKRRCCDFGVGFEKVMTERMIKIILSLGGFFLLLFSYFAGYSMWVMSLDSQRQQQIVSNTKQTMGYVQRIEGTVDGLRDDISAVKNKNDNQEIQINLNKQDIAALKGEVTSVNADINAHKIMDAMAKNP